MYTVRIGENDQQVPDLFVLEAMLRAGHLNSGTAVYDHENSEWKTVGSILATQNTSSLRPSDGEDVQWYYSQKKERKGPVSESEVARLIGTGALDSQSFVWNKSLADWQVLATTSLRRFCTAPPPLSGTQVGNGFVWILAFAPLIGLVIEGFVSGATEIAIDNLWWITLLLNIVLSYGDAAQLKKAGHDVSKFGGIAWLVPVYLWKRAAALRQSTVHFWIWIVLFAVLVLVPMGAL